MPKHRSSRSSAATPRPRRRPARTEQPRDLRRSLPRAPLGLEAELAAYLFHRDRR